MEEISKKDLRKQKFFAKSQNRRISHRQGMSVDPKQAFNARNMRRALNGAFGTEKNEIIDRCKFGTGLQ